MIATVQIYPQDPQTGRVTALVLFMDERGEIFREDRVTMGGGLSIQQLWHEAIKTAKQRCWEPEFIEAQEDVPKCVHGEPLLFGPCQWCRVEDERG